MRTARAPAPRGAVGAVGAACGFSEEEQAPRKTRQTTRVVKLAAGALGRLLASGSKQLLGRRNFSSDCRGGDHQRRSQIHLARSTAAGIVAIDGANRHLILGF